MPINCVNSHISTIFDPQRSCLKGPSPEVPVSQNTEEESPSAV